MGKKEDTQTDGQTLNQLHNRNLLTKLGSIHTVKYYTVTEMVTKKIFMDMETRL